MSIGVAALICWLLTAAIGSSLVITWAARAARPGRAPRPTYGRPPPYIPRRMVVAHVTLAAGGLVAWAGALVVLDQLAFVAIAALLAVALLGGGMFIRWLGSRRARRAALMLSGAPSESRLPTLLVLGHGLLGVTTVLLVLLSWLRPRG